MTSITSCTATIMTHARTSANYDTIYTYVTQSKKVIGTIDKSIFEETQMSVTILPAGWDEIIL